MFDQQDKEKNAKKGESKNECWQGGIRRPTDTKPNGVSPSLPRSSKPETLPRSSDREISIGPGTVQIRAHCHLYIEILTKDVFATNENETNALVVDLHSPMYLRDV